MSTTIYSTSENTSTIQVNGVDAVSINSSGIVFVPTGTITSTNMAAAIAEVSADVNTINGTAGSSLVGYMPSGTGAISTNVQNKLREQVSVSEFGAIGNGVADDTTAIQNARALVAATGGGILYRMKTHATGFWENLSALAQEWIRGSATSYATDIVPEKPVVSLKLFNGTPTIGPGYAAYGSRFDAYTKPGVDVSSTVAGSFNMQSYSSNSTGTNFNNTNQVALLANSSAMDTNSSASVEAINAIAVSAYTGSLPHIVAGVEADVAVSRAAGWFGESNKTYSVGFSAVLSDVTTGNGTMAFAAGSNNGSLTWLHGLVASGTGNTGVSIARDGARRPGTGMWVSSAVNYGIYVGASPLYQLNPGSIADYTYKPTVGIALGNEGVTNANSHILRLISTDGASTLALSDIYTTPGGNINFAFAGTSKLQIASFDGSLYMNGNKVLGNRDTSWGTNTGVTSKAGFDSATVTLQTLAQTVSALQQALKNHGIIGA